MSEFAIRTSLKFGLMDPDQLYSIQWGEMRDLTMLAYSNTPDVLDRRTIPEIEHYARAKTVEEFKRTRLHPEDLIAGGTFRPDQDIFNPRVAVASDEFGIVGFARSDTNYSYPEGAGMIQRKAHAILRPYTCLRELVVHPLYRGKGTAHVLAWMMLQEGVHFRPSTAYTFPGENPRMARLLEHLGYTPTGDPYPKDSFGEDFAPADMQRYQTDHSARRAAKRLLAIPGMMEVVSNNVQLG